MIEFCDLNDDGSDEIDVVYINGIFFKFIP